MVIKIKAAKNRTRRNQAKHKPCPGQAEPIWNKSQNEWVSLRISNEQFGMMKKTINKMADKRSQPKWQSVRIAENIVPSFCHENKWNCVHFWPNSKKQIKFMHMPVSSNDISFIQTFFEFLWWRLWVRILLWTVLDKHFFPWLIFFVFSFFISAQFISWTSVKKKKMERSSSLGSVKYT